MRYVWAAITIIGLLAGSAGVGGGYFIFNMQNTQSQLEESKSQAKALQNEVQSLREKEKKLAAERDSIETKMITLVDKLDAVNSSLNSNKRENEDLRVQVSDLKTQLQEVAAGLGVRIEEIKSSSKVRDAQIVNATRQIEESRKQVEELRKQIADLSKQIADLRKESAAPRDQQKPIATCTPGDTLFQEDFEYTDAVTNHGWAPLSIAGPAQTQFDIVAQGSRALKLNDVSSSSGNLYSHTIPALERNFQLDFYVRAEQPRQSIALQLQGNGGEIDYRITGIHIELSDSPSGGIRVQSVFPANYQPNKWYHIRLIVRTTTQSFDIYVDDMNNPLANDIKFIDTSFNRLRIGSGTPHTGSGYWDGIVIRNCSDQQKAIATCSPGDIIFQDDFEYTDSITNHDWVSVSTAGIVQTQTDTVAVGSRALKLNDVSSSALNTYIHTLPILNGNFQVDYYLRAEQYGQTVMLGLQGTQGVVDGQAKGIVTELSDNTNRNFRVQNAFYFAYQLNKWYHIRLIVKPALQSFDVYVDDMNNPLERNIKVLDTSFDRIGINTATTGIGAGYWDGIIIRCLP